MTDRRHRSHEGGMGKSVVTATEALGPHCHIRQEPRPDLVFDFTDLDGMDVYGLSLVLTAGQMARDEDRVVWLAGMNPRTAHILGSLGLSDFFRFMPTGAGRRN